MWEALIQVALSLIHEDPRYRHHTEADLLHWVLGTGSTAAPAPHRETADLLYLYAANIMNSGARGPSPDSVGRLVREALRDRIRDNRLQEFSGQQLAEGCIAYLKASGDRLVAGDEMHMRYLVNLQDLTRPDWNWAAPRRPILQRLLKSVFHFGNFLVTNYEGSASVFGAAFSTQPPTGLPNIYLKERFLEISPFPQMGVALGMNFLKDSQVPAFASADRDDAAEKLSAIRNHHAGWITKPDMHVLRLMLWLSARAEYSNFAPDALVYMQGAADVYANVPLPSGNWEYSLDQGRPRYEVGLWRCIEDLQNYSALAGVAPLGFDRLLYLVGSGKYFTKLQGRSSDQSFRYRCLTDAFRPSDPIKPGQVSNPSVQAIDSLDRASCNQVDSNAPEGPCRGIPGSSGSSPGRCVRPPNYPLFDATTPSLDQAAAPTRWCKVEGATVIRVTEATYRDCRPVSGVFELVNPDNEPRMLRGSLRAEVYCAWHGKKPRTVYPQITVGSAYEIVENYTGCVIDNIGTRPASDPPAIGPYGPCSDLVAPGTASEAAEASSALRATEMVSKPASEGTPEAAKVRKSGVTASLTDHSILLSVDEKLPSIEQRVEGALSLGSERDRKMATRRNRDPISDKLIELSEHLNDPVKGRTENELGYVWIHINNHYRRGTGCALSVTHRHARPPQFPSRLVITLMISSHWKRTYAEASFKAVEEVFGRFFHTQPERMEVHHEKWRSKMPETDGPDIRDWFYVDVTTLPIERIKALVDGLRDPSIAWPVPEPVVARRSRRARGTASS